MTFLLSEDKALREKLQGCVVTDQRSEGDGVPRTVRAYFGQPDQELTAQLYPYITIDMIDINRDTEREMRGMVSDITPNTDYLAPDSVTEGQGWQIHTPIPVSIDYQVTTYARHPRHDRELLAQIVSGKLPLRFGSLVLDDGTIRRLDVINVSKRDVTEQAKRLFVNAITVRVSSEISQSTLQTLYKVMEVNVDALGAQYAGGRPGDPNFTSVIPFTISN
jgi:hypothetical protein